MALPKTTVDRVLTQILDSITAHTISGGLDVALPGFGTFTRRDRPERMGHNPATGAAVLLAPSSTLAFRPSKAGPGKAGKTEAGPT